jgi:hypothetical protein
MYSTCLLLQQEELEELELEELEELQSKLGVEPSDPQTESALQVRL